MIWPNSHPLIYSPNAYNSHAWATVKPESRKSMQFSHIGDRNPVMLSFKPVFHSYLPLCVPAGSWNWEQRWDRNLNHYTKCPCHLTNFHSVVMIPGNQLADANGKENLWTWSSLVYRLNRFLLSGCGLFLSFFYALLSSLSFVPKMPIPILQLWL